MMYMCMFFFLFPIPSSSPAFFFSLFPLLDTYAKLFHALQKKKQSLEDGKLYFDVK